MHRNNLLNLISKYYPTYEEEKIYKLQIMDFLKSNKDCFERTLLIGHFTGSSWIVNYENTKFLLTHHKKLNMWLQLGGHADGNTNIIEVAKKEAYEEAGLSNLELVSHEIFDIDIHKLPEYKGIPSHYHYDIRFLLKVTNPHDQIHISDESNDLKWFETPPTDNIGINRMYQKWKKLTI